MSTTSTLKFFRIRSRSGILKIQRLETPSKISGIGARLVHISPDQKWLAIVGTDDNIRLCRIVEEQAAKSRPRLLSEMVHLRRLPRDPLKSKYQYGTHGTYNRSVTHLAFSANSRILAVGDLAGFLDTWVLEGHEDVTQKPKVAEAGQKNETSVKSDDEDSDEESDEEHHPNVILGQHWIRNPSAVLLIRLPASPLVLSFRPSSMQLPAALTNGGVGVHATRQTPHPHSHDLPVGEDRLCVLTAENQVYEFNVLSGKLSDWSRQNPASTFPREFRDVRDRGMGMIWDVRHENQRIWIYGATWLWMFDLSRNLPPSDDPHSTILVATGRDETKQLKRKRQKISDDDEVTPRSKHDTGAGSKISKSKLELGVAPEMSKIKGEDNSKRQVISLASTQLHSSDEEDDEDRDIVLANEDYSVATDSGRNIESQDEVNADSETQLTKQNGMGKPHYWHTYKYRPILGIVPIGGDLDDDDSAEADGDDADATPMSGLEVALVERPLWDVDLPPQYHGNQEWSL